MVVSDSTASLLTRSAAELEPKERPILFVVDSFLPGTGGAERQAVLLARILREQGVEVHFVAPRLDKSFPIHDEIEGFKVTRIDYPRVRFVGALLLMLKFSLFMLHHRHDYGFIHVHITKLLATCLGVLKPVLSAKIMTKISGHAEFTGGVLDLSKSTNLAYKVMAHYIQKLDYVQSISLYTRERLLAHGFSENQIIEVPNAVAVSSFADPDCFSIESDLVTIGFCGRIEKVKGLDLLVQSIKMLDVDIASKVRIVIAGDGGYRSTIEKKCLELGVDSLFTFVGMIDDVPGFLKTLDIYVQPSYAEGLSNSVLEAMSAALPVVASRISGNVDLVDEQETGYLFDSGDIDGLALCLETLITSRQQRLAMGKKGKARVYEDYSTESVSSRLKELYTNVRG